VSKKGKPRLGRHIKRPLTEHERYQRRVAIINRLKAFDAMISFIAHSRPYMADSDEDRFSNLTDNGTPIEDF
jgi:hypothetical protein